MPKELVEPGPVTSPEPIAGTPPSPAPTEVAATPPPAEGSPQASPAPSDKNPAPAKVETPAPDVLDRLSPDITQPTPPAVTPPASEPTKPDEEDDKPLDEDEPYLPPTEEEMRGYHSKTRRRIRQILTHAETVKNYADFGSEIISGASQNDVPVQSVRSWVDVGFAIRRGDPDAIQAVAHLLQTHGYQPTQAAPAADLTVFETTIERLYRDMAIDDETRDKLKEALKRSQPEEPNPQQQRIPLPQRQAPQQHQAPPTPLQDTASWVARQEAQYAQKYGTKWTSIRTKIYAEGRRRERSLPVEEINDPMELRTRYAACAAHVIAKEMAAQVMPPAVQSTLRATPSPTPTKTPNKGTPEYDDYILTHGV